MSKVDRNKPKRSTASESRYTVFEFDREFPDDAACLEWLKNYRYPDGVYCPKCERVTKHHREKARPSYSCQFCGHRVHPMKGTIFENSATSLKLWFYAIYIMASTRCGISAKQLERELGVTYKTAWRMFKQIRTLLTQDGEERWFGTVEMDEAYFGGRAEWKHRQRVPVQGRPSPARGDRPPVFGMAKRARPEKGETHGRVWAKAVSQLDMATIEPTVKKRILHGSRVITDEFKSYDSMRHMGYRHDRVRHSDRVYVSGDVHVQTIEGFWSLVKRGISGVYHGVGSNYLQAYLDEYVFRYNNRAADGRGMFNAFLGRISPGEPLV
jgi:transposase